MIHLPKFTTSVYGLLLWRLLLSLAALTFARVVFLVFNTDLLHLGESALWPAFAGGLRFDLAALVYLNAPMLLMHLLPFRFAERMATRRDLGVFYPQFAGIGGQFGRCHLLPLHAQPHHNGGFS